MGEAAFLGNDEASLRWAKQGTSTLVSLDADGDGIGDLGILLVGVRSLAGTDFL